MSLSAGPIQRSISREQAGFEGWHGPAPVPFRLVGLVVVLIALLRALEYAGRDHSIDCADAHLRQPQDLSEVKTSLCISVEKPE